MIRSIFNNFLKDRNISGDSTNWVNWQSKLSLKTCEKCAANHGKILKANIKISDVQIKEHINCVCVYVAMRTKKVGTVTDLGDKGPEMYLLFFSRLPKNYITKKEAKKYGWDAYKGNLEQVSPGSVIGGDRFFNDDGKLPSEPGRIWYEADINYEGGFRGKDRLIYSNDGLLFVTYDHYQTFYEIIL